MSYFGNQAHRLPHCFYIKARLVMVGDVVNYKGWPFLYNSIRSWKTSKYERKVFPGQGNQWAPYGLKLNSDGDI